MIEIFSILLLIVVILLVQVFYTQKNILKTTQNDLSNSRSLLSDKTRINNELNEKIITISLNLQKVQQIAEVGIWETYDDSSTMPFWSEELYEMLSLDKRTFKPTYKNFMKILTPEDRKKFKKKIYKYIER